MRERERERKDVKGGRNWSELFTIVGVAFYFSGKCDNEGMRLETADRPTVFCGM